MQRKAHDLICIAFSLGKSYFKLGAQCCRSVQKLFHFPLDDMPHCFNGTTMMVRMLTLDGWLFDLIKFVCLHCIMYCIYVYKIYLDDSKL